MRSRRLLTENILALSVLQMLNYAAPLLTVPYLVRVLGPAHFGMLSFAQAVVLYFDFATDYGFNFSATRAIASVRGQAPDLIPRIFWSTLYAKCALMCASAVGLSLLVVFVPKLREALALIAVNFLYIAGTTFFPIWLFQGLERLKLAAALFGVARLLTIPALLVFVRHPQDYVLAGAIQASVEALASILALPYLIKTLHLKWYKSSLSDVRASLREGWPAFLSGSASFLSSSSATVILGFTAGKIQVGYFAAAEKLIKASLAALNPIAQSLFPHLACIRTRSRIDALRLVRKSLFAVGALSLLLSIVTFVLAPFACAFILGAAFKPSIVVLQWLSPMPFLFGLMSVLGAQTMLLFDMDALLAKLMLRSAALGLPLIALFSRLFGAVGAAAGSVSLAALIVIGMIVTLQLHGLPVWRNLTEASDPLPVAICIETD